MELEAIDSVLDAAADFAAALGKYGLHCFVVPEHLGMNSEISLVLEKLQNSYRNSPYAQFKGRAVGNQGRYILGYPTRDLGRFGQSDSIPSGHYL